MGGFLAWSDTRDHNIIILVAMTPVYLRVKSEGCCGCGALLPGEQLVSVIRFTSSVITSNGQNNFLLESIQILKQVLQQISVLAVVWKFE